MNTVLELNSISKEYNKTNVVKNISFSVNENEILAILGPNGAGKSTTLNMISSIISPNTGYIKFNGENISEIAKKYKRSLGVVPQDLGIYENLTAEENLFFFGSLQGLSKKELHKNADEALELVGLQSKRKNYPHTFSGGMKRRLNIACALVHKPQIIIMDEPTVGIDPQSRNHILSAIITLKNHGASILYSTHYMEEVEQIANRIIFMDNGSIIKELTRDELTFLELKKSIYELTLDKWDNEKNQKLKNSFPLENFEYSNSIITFSLKSQSTILSNVFKFILQHDGIVTSVNQKKISLEDIFFNLTGTILRD